jgi:hypothetical protein
VEVNCTDPSPSVSAPWQKDEKLAYVQMGSTTLGRTAISITTLRIVTLNFVTLILTTLCKAKQQRDSQFKES